MGADSCTPPWLRRAASVPTGVCAVQCRLSLHPPSHQGYVAHASSPNRTIKTEGLGQALSLGPRKSKGQEESSDKRCKHPGYAEDLCRQGVGIMASGPGCSHWAEVGTRDTDTSSCLSPPGAKRYVKTQLSAPVGQVLWSSLSSCVSRLQEEHRS